MGRTVTITSWPEDHSVPVLGVNGGQFVIPFNIATAIPDAHYAALQASALGNPLIKYTDGGATGEPAAILTVITKTETHRNR